MSDLLMIPSCETTLVSQPDGPSLTRLRPHVRIGGRWHEPEADSGAGTFLFDEGKLRLEWTLTRLESPRAFLLAPVLIATEEAVWVEEIRIVPEGGVSLGLPMHFWDARYAHSDNLRVEQAPHCLSSYPYLRAVPAEPVTLGAGEDQPVGALYLTHRDFRHGIVLGAATQRINRIVWRIARAGAGEGPGHFALCEILYRFGQSGGWRLEPGERLALDTLYVQFLERTEPQDAWSDYQGHLAATHRMRGAVTALRNSALYCSWNFGRFRDQYEDRLLETARFIAENLPGIGWFLMDAGYMIKEDPARNRLCPDLLSRFYPDPETFLDRGKFPSGIRHYSDRVRALGLRPGIWWSPSLWLESPLARERPDWLLLGEDGEPVRLGRNGFLDYSVPEARAWIDGVLETVLVTWGMDAIKIDFWSQMFDLEGARFRAPNVTGVMLRERFLAKVRSLLPEDGVLMTCIATGMGNPFIGQWADTYRNSIDIGEGRWEEHLHNCEWALANFVLHGRRSFLLNTDGLGFPETADFEQSLFRLHWGFATMGILEIDGFPERLDAERVARLRRLTDRCDQGHRVRTLDPAVYTGLPYPNALLVTFPGESRTRRREGVRHTLALFNWSERPAVVCLRRGEIGSPGPDKLRDFWSGSVVTPEGDEFLRFPLEPRTSRLLDVLV